MASISKKKLRASVVHVDIFDYLSLTVQVGVKQITTDPIINILIFFFSINAIKSSTEVHVLLLLYHMHVTIYHTFFFKHVLGVSVLEQS